MSFKNALISVSDKSGLVDFLRPLIQKGLRIVSTGGTSQFLKDNGFTVVDISEQTEFPEVMGGRVKTLHPKVHMALLSREGNAEDTAVLKQFNVEPFDLMICNLYPFEQTLKANPTEKELIEKIDVGGPSMLRAAAKNFQRLAVLSDPQDYSWVQKASLENTFTLADRKKLAGKVFALTSFYDSLIAESFKTELNLETFIFGGRQVQELRYGENPQQKAWWYQQPTEKTGIHKAEILQGKTLSYNNILDLEAATSLAAKFTEATCVAVKHNNPCGVASASAMLVAVQQALKADPVSVFGGIIAMNKNCEEDTAKILSELFLECIIAPGFSDGAKQIFAKKKNLRILVWPEMLSAKGSDKEVKSIQGGFLVQEKDNQYTQSEWKCLSEAPDDKLKNSLLFAEKICASLKSNAIAIVSGTQTVGLGMGQVNRVDALNQAIERMQKFHPEVASVAMASDAFFPFTDSLEIAVKNKIQWILQPGGSVKDEEIFSFAKKNNINMIITGTRHFKH